MNDRVELYESLVRLGLLLIFTLSLTAASFGLISICQMLMRSHVVSPESATYRLVDY